MSTPLRRTGHLSDLDRRDFIKVAAAGVASPLVLGTAGHLLAEEKPAAASQPETLVTQLYKSLTEEQQQGCAFKFDDPLRQKVDKNWFITKLRIGKDFNQDQQKLIEEIFLGLHSPEYAKIVMGQVDHDGGFHDCAIALFGQPGTGKFEFVLSGRHVTRRCDGDSVEGAAFGGPIFYGHAARAFNEPADHEGNVYWYQAKRANELFQALDGKQREVLENRYGLKTGEVKASGKIPFPSGAKTYRIQAKTDITNFAAHVENARLKITLK